MNASNQRKSSSWAIGLLLLVTAALMLVWSHFRPMWNDEFLSFYTDRGATMKAVLGTQLHHPLSLDPPTYHLLSHMLMKVFGASALALRLPAMCGFLFFLYCIFVFVRRMAGERAALIAAVLPLMTFTAHYSVEGRPYGVLLGMYGLGLIAWQAAIRPHCGPRLLALAGITVSIWVAMTSHYFGVLIVVPLLCGECTRAFQRRRIDWPVSGAILLGLAIGVALLPFQRALKPYRLHYYKQSVGLHDILQGYRELFVRYVAFSPAVQKAIAALLTLAILTLVVLGIRRFRRRPSNQSAAEWSALASTALLPLFGFLIAVTVTHVMELRYVLAALIGFITVAALVIAPWLRRSAVFAAVLTLVATAALLNYAHNIIDARQTKEAMLFARTPHGACAVNLAKQPSAMLYTQTPNDFYIDHYYSPDPAVRSRVSLLYDERLELKWRQHDVNSVTAHNLIALGSLSVTPWRVIIAQPDPYVLIYPNGWEWVPDELRASHIAVTDIGPCLGGELLQLHPHG